MALKHEKSVPYPAIVVILLLVIGGLAFKDAIFYREVVPLIRHPSEETRYRANRITGSLEKLEKGSDTWVHLGAP